MKIPRYFRCGDPSQKCPLSVTKELIKEDKDWVCPRSRSDSDEPRLNCHDFRERASFVDGVSGGRSGLVYSGLATLFLLVLFSLYLGSTDDCAKKTAILQDDFQSLRADFDALASSPKPSNATSPPPNESAITERKIGELETGTKEALAQKDASRISALAEVAKKLSSSVANLRQSMDAPVSGSGTRIADARKLLGKFESLEAEVEKHQEADCPDQGDSLLGLRDSIRAAMAQTRSLATPVRNKGKSHEELQDSIDAWMDRIAAAKAKLDKFLSTPRQPFGDDEAELVIGTVPDLLDSLVVPLTETWSGTTNDSIEAGGAHFIDGPSQGKIVVRPLSASEGFSALAQRKIDLYVADRSPTNPELGRFGEGVRISRSIAEVIALDAVTLLVHPDQRLDLFEAGKPFPLRVGAGPEGSPIRERARRLGFVTPNSLDSWGEGAALRDREIVALGFYHLERNNLRAKRLAVKPSTEATPYKPSHFSIATEDYRYSYRISAWTLENPKEKASAQLEFMTSDAGQAIINNRGFVNLRLRPLEEKIDDIRLVALGEALGLDSIRSGIRLSTNIHFAVGKDHLDLKAQADLARIPNYIQQSYPTHKVVILGFTDSDGNQSSNEILSKNRAKKVADELLLSKVSTQSTGLGSALPIDTNKTEEGKARNRRAEVWVVKP